MTIGRTQHLKSWALGCAQTREAGEGELILEEPAMPFERCFGYGAWAFCYQNCK